MKDIYKNPILYYILIPVLVALWSLLVSVIYLPKAGENWKKEKAQYLKAEGLIAEILELDAGRLTAREPNKAAVEFDYATAISNTANMYRIPSRDYKISSGRVIKSSGQKSQTANLALDNIGIKTFAEFFSSIQLRWSKLQCLKIKLTKKKGMPDLWKADLEFKYYY